MSPKLIVILVGTMIFAYPIKALAQAIIQYSADINQNNVVDIADFNILVSQYGTSPDTLIPTPTIPIGECNPSTNIEAEAAVATSGIALINDSQASGGQYIQNISNSDLEAIGYCVEAPATGPYTFLGTTRAQGDTDNSWYISINFEELVWEYPSSSEFTSHTAQNPQTQAPHQFNLTEGFNYVVFRTREQGSVLDKFSFTPVSP